MRGVSGAVFAGELEDLQAAELGHAVVEDGDVNGVSFEEFEGFAAGVGEEEIDALRDEKGADGVLPCVRPARRGGEEDGKAGGSWGGGVHHGVKGASLTKGLRNARAVPETGVWGESV